MKFGLTQEEYAFVAAQVIEPLRARGATVWCFGSRARGDYQKFSDLDLMVESDEDLSGTLSILRELVEESNFPFKIDLAQKRFFASSYLAGFERDKLLF
jgi:predicted nucleotidyltransferase